ncbi:hypothetical protein [Sediminibacterium soli]|uniref:hypothetical protein n=1 Tax=Sediminibacterium soli TaxID=2698829 RepID=UPI001379D36C|nr:hypothetical protein [Sediminibacterium soli]NCI46275.1 hypothetical protein [Sediminibacterium soli]
MMPSREYIPSRYAILPYYGAAAFVFVVTTVLCLVAAPAFAGHYFQPKLLAITHLAVLGWATLLIFGATNQLAPVIAERSLYSERIPMVVLALLLLGLLLLIPSFWFFSVTRWSYTGGALLLTAMLLHAHHVFKTMKHGRGGIAADCILTAHVWLILTATIGLLLLVNLRYPFLPQEHLHYLKIHGSVGMAGWFLQLVIGVSSRLIPMFLLSRSEKTGWLTVTYYLVNLGLVFFLVDGMTANSDWGRPLCFLLVLAGLGFYFLFVKKCYTSAIRKKMDSGMKQTFLALLLISLPFVLLSAAFIRPLSAPSLVTAYGVSFFIGFISTLIMGQTFKTLPFIVWMHMTKPDQLPEILPKDLFSERLVQWQMYVFLSGYLLLLMGILSTTLWMNYAGASLLVLAATGYLFHVLFIIRKLVNHAL